MSVYVWIGCRGGWGGKGYVFWFRMVNELMFGVIVGGIKRKFGKGLGERCVSEGDRDGVGWLMFCLGGESWREGGRGVK